MREDLLHYVWKYKKLPLSGLLTSNNMPVDIVDSGTHNHQAGPDFFNAKINIDNQLWAGNVEIHLKSSDWYAHRHENDSNYENVILHVVWEDDAAVFRKDGSEIPTIVLKNYISSELLLSYKNLFDRRQKGFINCEKNIGQIDPFLLQNWFGRLYFERLERKSSFIYKLLSNSKNDWEKTLFAALLKNFGLKINGESFLSLAENVDFSIVRKLQADISQLESILYGMCHLLDDETIVDTYYINQKKEYAYLKNKFGLSDIGVITPEFFKLRPPNFPTIRLSQIANLYGRHQNLLDKVVHSSDLGTLYEIFDISASPYWNDHFTFGKVSKKRNKKLTKPFIDLLIINTILPLKFCYGQQRGKEVNEEIISIVSQIKAENNSIISNFKIRGVPIKNANNSQAVLQLYNEYCIQHRCLECAVGNSLLR